MAGVSVGASRPAPLPGDLSQAESQSPAAKKPGRQSKAAEHKRAAVRQAWMDERHLGWACVEWSRHTGSAYKTIKKYHDGVTTTTTPSIRASIVLAERVAFPIVPE